MRYLELLSARVDRRRFLFAANEFANGTETSDAPPVSAIEREIRK